MKEFTLTTLEAVPPGQQPSNIKPTEREGESPKNLLIISPKAGIIEYWAMHPKSIWQNGGGESSEIE